MRKKSLIAVFFILSFFLACAASSCGKTTPEPSEESDRDMGGSFNNETTDTTATNTVIIDTTKYLLESQINLDTSEYPDARNFPGLVGIEEPRLKNFEVILNMDYNPNVAASLRISVPPQPQYSVGLYAPPGELITVEVPQGISGLTMQIGAWTDNLSQKDNPGRVPVIYSRKQLQSGKNTMRNPYGGTIYIRASHPFPSLVKFKFTGVVKSPDFILGQSASTTWWNEVQKSTVPWLELRSPNLIVTLPRKRIIAHQLSDPYNATYFWDEVIKRDYYLWMGLEVKAADPKNEAPGLPMRAVLDKNISVGYAHNGYPVMMIDNEDWFNSFTDYNTLQKAQAWGVFHEIGHDFQQNSYWSWSQLGETTNNLFVFKTAHKLNADPTALFPGLHPALKDQFPKALAFAESTERPKFFRNLGDPFADILPFIQMFHAGDLIKGTGNWNFMTFLYTKARHAAHSSSNDLKKKEFLYEAISEFTQKDWLPFFKAWGIELSQDKQDEVHAKYPYINKKYWTYDPLKNTGGTASFTYSPASTSGAYDPANWSIVNYSSQENFREDGRAKNAIDGYVSTFWHSHWSSGSDGLLSTGSQWIEVDMGQKLEVTTFHFFQRGSHSDVRIKKCSIEVSDNGTDWRIFDTLTMADQSGEITAKAAKDNFRYFKIIAESSYGGTYASLAEVWVTDED